MSLDTNISFPERRQRVLVTGHDGYLGKVLVPQLQAEGFSVTGMDTLLYRGCRLYSDEITVRNINKDIRDVDARDLAGFDAIVHLAGLSNDPLGNLDPDLTFDINYRGTLKLAAAAKQAGITRFVQASTCSIYGASDDGWLTESSPFNPVTPYGKAKALVEADLPKHAAADFSPVLLRFGTAYGTSPRLRGDLVVNNLVGYAMTSGQILLKSDGNAWRPLVHVEDMARAIVAVLSASRETVHNQAFNIGSTAENYKIRQVAEMIGDCLPEAKIVFADGAEPDRRNYRVNCDKYSQAFPHAKTQWPLERGIHDLVKVYRRVQLKRASLEGPALQRVKRIQQLLENEQVSGDLRWPSFARSTRAAA